MSARRRSASDADVVVPWSDAPALLAWLLGPLADGVSQCDHLDLDEDGTNRSGQPAGYLPAIDQRIVCGDCIAISSARHAADLDSGRRRMRCSTCNIPLRPPFTRFSGPIQAGIDVVGWFCPGCVSAAREAAQ